MNSDKTTFDMSHDEKRTKARETAELRYWFRWHFIIYAIVNAAFLGIWYITGTLDFLWPLIPAGLWIFGLIAHYFLAYRRVGGGWIDKETEKILQDLS